VEKGNQFSMRMESTAPIFTPMIPDTNIGIIIFFGCFLGSTPMTMKIIGGNCYARGRNVR